MRSQKLLMWLLALMTAVFMSVPYLVPHCGVFALFGLVPLLCMDKIATDCEIPHVWKWHYSSFLLWNFITTFWVCNATVGGGIFAAFANAFQMSVVFGLFRLSKRFFKGSLPYIFLVAAWIAWERYYLTVAQISWPWLVLGNSMARTLSLAQFYEFTGTLGGSLWVWASNLSIFGLMSSLANGRWQTFNVKAKTAAIATTVLVIFAPMAASITMYGSYKETSEPVDFSVFQPNIDPYSKFQALTQEQQDAIIEDMMKKELAGQDSASTILALCPETFTRNVDANDIEGSSTVHRLESLTDEYKGLNVLVGASTYDLIPGTARPSQTARHLREDLWLESHNSAIMLSHESEPQIFHKNKLVVAVEMTPYPAIFRHVDEWLGGVMGHDIGDGEADVLYIRRADGLGSIPVGCAICYESIYGEYCTQYVRKGARLMTVITNDAWWGDTPGYRQHLSYASLRAIETRRDIVRCGNTGISAYINQRGDVIEKTPWWQQAVLTGTANLNDKETFFVHNGDIVGRVCVFVFAILLLAMIVRRFVPQTERRN